MQPKITKEEVLKNGNIDDLLMYMSQNNAEEFNRNKAIEEASEFIEATIKMYTKSKKNPKRPTIQDVIGEYADTVLRGRVYVQSLLPELTISEVEDKLNAHIKMKTNKLLGWLEKGTYENGL